MRFSGRCFCALFWTAVTILVLVPPAAAQSVWELTPYRIHVVVAVAPVPELTPRLQTELLGSLVTRTDALIGASWNLTAAPAPRKLQPALLRAIGELSMRSLPTGSLEQRKAANDGQKSRAPEEPLDSDAEAIARYLTALTLRRPPTSPEYDKLILLAVVPDRGGCRVTARELDVRTRTWSLPVSRQVPQLAKLRDAALDALMAAFAPLARIDDVEGNRVVLRLKAAALPVRDDEQLTLVKPGDVFQPIIRYDERDGQPRGILPVPWTFCTVEEVGPEKLDCRVYSGLRSPLSARRRGRVQQLALAVVAPRKPSTLRLVAQSDPKRALAGYEVFGRDPDSKTATLLGRTDRRGRITVPPGKGPLCILLVRNGNELLARLPIVPGAEEEIVAEIADDDERLEAEGFITGLQEELVDLVTQREVLIARIRARIEAGEFDEAAEVVDQLRRLPSESEFDRILAEQQKRIRSANPAAQAKINALFGDTRKLVGKHLDPAVVEDLWQQLRKARGDVGG
ncbi:MAG: hypothetical protein A2V70_09975 [Planctomycetes bacterium RBG_13_63_9]|nr:MAG: hypothetical protein A2V70_09975 [Planctomycetes bacterium RBG_13_63_9]